MTLTKLIIAFLIVCPFDPPMPERAPPELWQALKDVALEWELVGLHENWANDFGSEVAYCRHYWRLNRNAPPRVDALRWPANFICREYAMFASQYRSNLEARLEEPGCSHHIDAWRAAARETRHRELIWSNLAFVTDRTASWARQRYCLARLRELLGEEAYYAGRLPAPVPLECFARVN